MKNSIFNPAQKFAIATVLMIFFIALLLAFGNAAGFTADQFSF